MAKKSRKGKKKKANKKIDNKNSSPILVKNVKGFAMFLNMPEFQDVGFLDKDEFKSEYFF